MKKLIVFFSLALIMSSGNAQSKFKGAWCGQELSGKSSELYTKCLLQNPEIFIPDYPNHKLVAYTIELLGEDIKVIIDRKVSTELDFERLMTILKMYPDIKSCVLKDIIFLSEKGDIMKWNQRFEFSLLY